MTDDDLHEILGFDPDPELSEEERRAIVARVSAAEEAALDRVLELDRVDVPAGLAGRVRAAVQAERAPARRFPLRLVGGGLLAAAAAWAAMALRPEVPRGGPGGEAVRADAATAAGAGAAPDDELLAALTELEELDVLLDLEPFEADVLLMFDPEDELLLELLDGNG